MAPVFLDGGAFFEEVVEPAIAECERQLAEAEHQAEKGVKSDD